MKTSGKSVPSQTYPILEKIFTIAA